MKRRDFIKSTIAAGGLLGLGGIAYASQSNCVEITKKKIKIHNFPSKLRILAVSDIHAPSLWREDESLISLMNDQNPDIVILAGDIVDRRGKEDLVGMFAPIRCRYFKLAILGNWEYCGGLDLSKLAKAYERAGIFLLVNQKINCSGISIVGLDDYLYGSPEFNMINSAEGSVPILAVGHCPTSFDRLRMGSVPSTIMLAGHTHGGQIAPWGIALVKPAGCGRYLKGWYSRGNHRMYVMRGIGTSGIPLRIGSNPELLVLDLEGAEG